MGTSNRSVLVIFVKNSEAGHVKTRLAESVGEEEALRIYETLLSHTMQISKSLKTDKQVWYSKEIPESDIWDGQFEKKVQCGAGLGQRMSHAFNNVFKNGYRKTAIIGSDCARLTTAIIEEAFEMLDEYDTVIGPSKDGGYYLLALRKYVPELFKGIDWSTPRVLPQTRETISRLGLSSYMLEELNDVDTIEDWEEVKSKVDL